MKGLRMRQFLLLAAAITLLSFVSSDGGKKKPAKKKKTSVARVVPKPVPADTTGNPYYIIVDKSDYELKVYDDEGWYATYPVVFGSKDLTDKYREGDKRTPDGSFRVILKKIHKKWGPELLLDYPNEESVRRFNDRKQKGTGTKNSKNWQWYCHTCHPARGRMDCG